MANIDPRLLKKFKQLEQSNLRLQGEVKALRETQSNQGGSSIKRKIGSMLQMHPLGDRIAMKHLYIPPKKGNPTGNNPNLTAEKLFGRPGKVKLF